MGNYVPFQAKCAKFACCEKCSKLGQTSRRGGKGISAVIDCAIVGEGGERGLETQAAIKNASSARQRIGRLLCGPSVSTQDGGVRSFAAKCAQIWTDVFFIHGCQLD